MNKKKYEREELIRLVNNSLLFTKVNRFIVYRVMLFSVHISIFSLYPAHHIHSRHTSPIFTLCGADDAVQMIYSFTTLHARSVFVVEIISHSHGIPILTLCTILGYFHDDGFDTFSIFTLFIRRASHREP